MQELRDLYDSAAKEVGEANAAIFEMQQMILEDQGDHQSDYKYYLLEHKLNARICCKKCGGKCTGKCCKE